jgi:tRNA pseudouridine13 synthase
MLLEYQDWCRGLEKAGLSAERRSLRSRVMDLKWVFQNEDQLVLEFTLDKGCYANAVVRELLWASMPKRQF